MLTKRFVTASLLALAVFGCSREVVEHLTPQTTIRPNDKVQSFLRTLASPDVEERRKLFPVGTEEGAEKKLAELRTIAGGEKELVLQLLYLRSHARNEREAWVPAFVVKQLNISNTAFFEACLPLLDSEDETTRRLGFDGLTRVDYVPDGGVDFSGYESILREKSPSAARGLIRYLYWRNPQAAVVSVARVYAKDVPTSDVEANAKSGIRESMNYFMERPEWWAHLYVAAMLEKESHLQTPEMMKRLEKDANSLVVEKVTKMKINAGKAK